MALDLKGKVRLEPPFPEVQSLEISKEHASLCGKTKESPKLKVSPEGWVANAVVKLEGNLPLEEDSLKEKDYTLDQINCEFSPHILLIPKGATVSILNSEAILHNVRAFDEKAEMLFNDAMPKKGQVLKKRFDDAGRFVFRCGVHHWMHAFVIVKEHPFYALTDETGSFKIKNIPEGMYTLTVWHEELGEIKAEVSPETKSLLLTYHSTR